MWPEMLNFSGSQHLRGQNIQNMDGSLERPNFSQRQNIARSFQWQQNSSPCNARRAGTSPGPWTWGPCSGPCTRSSWGPRSSSPGRSGTPCSSAAARHPHSPPRGRSRGAGGGPDTSDVRWLSLNAHLF